MRILLTDGSGLTSRQVATHLALRGHHVEVLSPDRFCLGRFTRAVRRVHPVPAYGQDPFGWLDDALDVYVAGGFELLFPTQEQVAVLAAVPGMLRERGVVTAVPSFPALARVQDKLAAARTLREFGLSQPPSEVVASAGELAARADLVPAFVKSPIGTATTGVRRVAVAAALNAVAAELAAAGAFPDGGVLVQRPVAGPLVMAQSVFARGELLAAHTNLRVREGASGGASHKRSLDLPGVRRDLARLGAELGWHGALSVDLILTPDGPRYIDVNPRLVEPANAAAAGVDLVGALLTAAGVAPAPAAPPLMPPSEGVATHQLLLALLGAAAQGRGRRGVGAELAAAALHRGSYRGSREELTPVRRDLAAAALLATVAATVLIRPAGWRWFSSGSVAAYALTPAAWRAISRG